MKSRPRIERCERPTLAPFGDVVAGHAMSPLWKVSAMDGSVPDSGGGLPAPGKDDNVILLFAREGLSWYYLDSVQKASPKTLPGEQCFTAHSARNSDHSHKRRCVIGLRRLGMHNNSFCTRFGSMPCSFESIPGPEPGLSQPI